MYGTSEAGLCNIAALKVLDTNMNEVETGCIGQFCVDQIKTGELGFLDEKGYYFLSGRIDDMVVSAGENVYPIEVEQVLIKHPAVENVAVIGVNDEEFGQRLKAFVFLVKNSDVTKVELFQWLRVRLARFQMPREITFVEYMPYTPLGKMDKKI